MRTQHGFVEDGHPRAVAGLKEAIRAEVLAEFNERLRQARFWQRLQLHCEMRGEVARRLEMRVAKSAPPDALY